MQLRVTDHLKAVVRSQRAIIRAKLRAMQPAAAAQRPLRRALAEADAEDVEGDRGAARRSVGGRDAGAERRPPAAAAAATARGTAGDDDGMEDARAGAEALSDDGSGGGDSESDGDTHDGHSSGSDDGHSSGGDDGRNGALEGEGLGGRLQRDAEAGVPPAVALDDSLEELDSLLQLDDAALAQRWHSRRRGNT